jgi:predicted PolB exonuclease-like 3'-5' exonuclease
MDAHELQRILFLDIETVPQTKELAELSPALEHLWNEKYNLISKRMPEKYDENVSPANAYQTSAGIYSEFGKIICISVGYLFFKNNEMYFRTKSFKGDDEKSLLTEFIALVEKFCTTKDHTLCGHNIKEFDIPFICRRSLINHIALPPIFQISSKKPWEINFIDTLELWKFGDYKNFTSLKLLAAVFNIPTPKDDIDGSQVASVYYDEKNLDRIATYCQKDVVATAQVFLKMKSMDTIKVENIETI